MAIDQKDRRFPHRRVHGRFSKKGKTLRFLAPMRRPIMHNGRRGHLAANQAAEVDPAADAEPGKILHEVRYGEMAELGEVPFRRYYGSIDSTPLFVMLAGEYLKRTWRFCL